MFSCDLMLGAGLIKLRIKSKPKEMAVHAHQQFNCKIGVGSRKEYLCLFEMGENLNFPTFFHFNSIHLVAGLRSNSLCPQTTFSPKKSIDILYSVIFQLKCFHLQLSYHLISGLFIYLFILDKWFIECILMCDCRLDPGRSKDRQHIFPIIKGLLLQLYLL